MPGLLICVVIGMLLLQACSAPSQTLVFLGDSFTAGDGVGKKSTFPLLVGRELAAVKALNQGRSGWPTSAYLRRWEEVAAKIPPETDMVLIQLGANDLRVDGHREETIVQCRSNMEEITRRLEAQLPGVEIVLMSSVKIDTLHLTPHIREAGFGQHSNAFLAEIGVTYQELAREKGYGYIDLIPAIPEEGTHDGAHMTEEGHRLVAEKILAYLRTGY